MSKISRTQYTILGMLAIEPKSGYDIKKAIEGSTSNFWSESTGQLYPNLERLLREKSISCDMGQGVGNRVRKVYAITAKGMAELRGWLLQPAELPTQRDEFLLKLFFGKNMSVETCVNHVKRRIRMMEETAERLAFFEQHIKQGHTKDSDAPYWLLTVDYGRQMVKAELEWCRLTLKKLEKWK